MKKLVYAVLLFSIIFILGGCNMKNDEKEKEIINKAKETAIQHFKETKNLDIVVTETKFAPNELGGIFVIGYVKGNKERKVNATIDYEHDYYVESIGYDDEK
ncbi:hypothetical protein CN996_28130 [Bacillus cereus]|nr:hypothetical protein CON40_24825 [Bacillus cereus]PEV95975.1 hypothetical protein CN428_28215 [Bacillus cereus]PEZ84477.1 hypothetical protein CN374_27530 [Bacillus cereus]PFB91709.1 hypothetical protein CN296_29005 [Bacillus cereus]PFE51005.1 hypothetical protein CN318_27540 [Bacillus cereus]